MRKSMPDKDKLEEMFQEGWKIVSTYGNDSLILAKGEIRRLVDITNKCVIAEYNFIS